MWTTVTGQPASAPPAACIPAIDGVPGVRAAVPERPASHGTVAGGPAVRTAPALTRGRAAGSYGISVSNGDDFVGKGVPAAAQRAGDVRGVPPRGKPV
jgi:hypothetical protein